MSADKKFPLKGHVLGHVTHLWNLGRPV